MTDELERLRRALGDATPAPDPARKAAALRRAAENFDALQETAEHLRPTPVRTIGMRVSEGVKRMLSAINTRGLLAGTTAIAAVALVWVVQNQSGIYRPAEPGIEATETTREQPARGEREVPADSDAARTRSPDAEAFPAPQAPAADPAPGGLQAIEEDAVAGLSELAGTPSVATLGKLERRAAPLVMDEVAILPMPDDRTIATGENTEAFPQADPSPLKVTVEEPVSTFSVDVDTASWAVLRSSLTAGRLPVRDAVRIEEMINYFPYDYPAPAEGEALRPTVTVMPTPWNADTRLVHIGIQGVLPEIAGRPPLNLVFLIDTSGSMQDADKLPLLKQSFRLMLSELRPEDEVAIVTYAGSAGLALEPTVAGDRAAILAALERLEAGGSTAGQAGLQQAYATAERMAADGEVTRVILATDGDFNVGLSDPDALEDFIAEKRGSGTYLSVLGFGRGNLDDATMQALAQNGNGQAAYIDTLTEARKVLVDQLTGALFPIANDGKIQVEFNPARIAEYRLVGYETRALAREDFNNDRVDAGEIGAGHSVTAIYEVTPVGSPAVMTDPLRYGTAEERPVSDELGFFRLRYKTPGARDSRLIETPIVEDGGTVTDGVRFAAAIAGFGQLLRGEPWVGDWSYGDAIRLATAARGEDPFGYRAEAVSLMRLAESLSN